MIECGNAVKTSRSQAGALSPKPSIRRFASAFAVPEIEHRKEGGRISPQDRDRLRELNEVRGLLIVGSKIPTESRRDHLK